MKVKLNRNMFSPDYGCHSKGDVVDLPEAFALDLIERGAKAVDESKAVEPSKKAK